MKRAFSDIAKLDVNTMIELFGLILFLGGCLGILILMATRAPV